MIFENMSELLKKEGGAVSVKIIETADEDLIEKIAISSNSQSRIFGRDLKVFDPLQDKFAVSIEQLGYFYKRKRSEKLSDKREAIDMARAGQLLLAYQCGEPTLSKTAGNDVFDEHYSTIFNPEKTTGELIVAAYRCYKKIEYERQKAVHWQKSALRNSFAETWIIEGHFHILFVVGELMRRKGLELSDFNAAESLVEEAYSIVDRFVKLNPAVASYRLFRLKTSKSALMNLIDAVPMNNVCVPIQLNLI